MKHQCAVVMKRGRVCGHTSHGADTCKVKGWLPKGASDEIPIRARPKGGSELEPRTKKSRSGEDEGDKEVSDEKKVKGEAGGAIVEALKPGRTHEASARKVYEKKEGEGEAEGAIVEALKPGRIPDAERSIVEALKPGRLPEPSAEEEKAKDEAGSSKDAPRACRNVKVDPHRRS